MNRTKAIERLITNDKYKAVSNHTGMGALEILKEQGRE